MLEVMSGDPGSVPRIGGAVGERGMISLDDKHYPPPSSDSKGVFLGIPDIRSHRRLKARLENEGPC